ncbi:5-(carboxyamino)imidazole ribonucleotide synthase [Salicibibacter kimchii]|uniref:N5-carboxyaminoimidazole ribonucleotide synthase n=1 Tax=Salicibibacter kimchii TaxID=2099786 RepID=A0A345C2T7_9BACI|nr:5-(carboxyamino)imidazole ribonucleotide synthase [Salicibibacter kimchii]AXF57518.1 5-(carboxyamino)imidazole ribonucleotide synthase [Salicibibacter kimchii]
MITPGKTIGILGGGQLGRMMALEAKAMGYRIAVLEPKADAPAAQVADEEIVAAYDDDEAVRKLAAISDVVTFEFENVDAETAAILEEEKKLPQGARFLRICQHRLREKEALTDAGLDAAPYLEVIGEESLRQGIAKLGRPAVLKTCRGGYDGKGQVVIRDGDDVLTAYEQLKDLGDLVLEQWVPFAKEISVIVTRTETGEIVTFPIAENDHEDNILKRTIVPARIDEKAEQSALEMAETFAENISLVGTLAIEMFYLEDGSLYVNELAPRPHNSGHYSIDACNVSQFHLHVRAICGWPLITPELATPVVMDNVLGEHVETAIETIPDYRNTFLHLYGKAEARPGRKMGHVNVTGKTREEALANVKKLAIRS